MTHEEVTEEDSLVEMPCPKDALEKELAICRQAYSSVFPQEVQDLFKTKDEQWEKTDILELALKKGDIAPDFALPDQDGNIVSSIDLRSKGPLVIIFYRGNWCNYCNATLKMIRKYTPHLKARGASVVAISSQTVEKSKSIMEEGGLNFPVLSDLGSEYAQMLNIAFIQDEEVMKVLNKKGVKFEDYNDDDSGMLPLPATYVIDNDGKVIYSFVETDYTKRAEPADILNALPPAVNRNQKRSLSEKLEAEYTKLLEGFPEQKRRLLMDAVQRTKESGMDSKALKAGDKAPDFKLPGRDGEYIDSKKLRRQGPLVVSFNYGHKSSLCMVHLQSLQRYLSKFEAKGASIVSISPFESSPNEYQISVSNDSRLPLLSDNAKHTVAKQFGLIHRVPGFLVGTTSETIEVPMAATYVIDSSGTILYAFVTADPTKRADPSQIVRKLPVEFQKKTSVTRGPFSLLRGTRMSPMLRLTKRQD